MKSRLVPEPKARKKPAKVAPDVEPARLEVRNFGPIKHADVTFGDFTVLIGPQASGKSLFAQTLKLVMDKDMISSRFKAVGVDWLSSKKVFLDAYFGVGMSRQWKNAKVCWLEKQFQYPFKTNKANQSREHCAYIPAQRAVTIRDGWPQDFVSYGISQPYTVRDFSDFLRTSLTIMSFMDSDDDNKKDFGSGIDFVIHRMGPVSHGLDSRVGIDIRNGFKVGFSQHNGQKRLALLSKDNKDEINYNLWSTGQREFIPLYLGLRFFTDEGEEKSAFFPPPQYIVVEEPEMGLHPEAIGVAILLLLELCAKGYKLVVSTHSSQVLETIWAIKELAVTSEPVVSVLSLLKLPKEDVWVDLTKTLLKRSFKAYYFDRASGNTRDISSLDVDSPDPVLSEWGGLLEFSGRVNEVVAKAVARTRLG